MGKLAPNSPQIHLYLPDLGQCSHSDLYHHLLGRLRKCLLKCQLKDLLKYLLEYLLEYLLQYLLH